MLAATPTNVVHSDSNLPNAPDLTGINRRQVQRGDRFDFGRNWRNFARRLTEPQIAAAEQSLCRMLGWRGLRGRTFLDVGSGSGLFSLAACRLGASRVFSFDFDPLCVDCTRSVRDRFLPQAAHWEISGGDVLSGDFMRAIGTFDVVYSWGMLHQTSDMWRGMQNVLDATAPGGRLFLSIYNHQPILTPFWRFVKRTYNRLPRPLGQLMVVTYLAAKVPLLAIRRLAAVTATSPTTISSTRPVASPTASPTASPENVSTNRGMNAWNDAVDWVGGYPFETASAEEVFRFYRDRGLHLIEISTVGGGSGCNEFVFERPQVRT